MGQKNILFLTCLEFLCRDELMLDYNHTIFVEQNGHHLAKNFFPKSVNKYLKFRFSNRSD